MFLIAPNSKNLGIEYESDSKEQNVFHHDTKAVVSLRFFRVAKFLAAMILILCLVCLLLIASITFIRMRQRAEISQLNDSQNYLISLTDILGDKWQQEDIISDINDIRGTNSSIAGATRIRAFNKDNQYATINYHSIAYMNDEVARERYFIQEEWIFDYDFGVPPSIQIFSYRDIPLPEPFNIGADEYRIACKDIYDLDRLIETRCGALFLYGNHVAFLDAFTMRDSVNYLSLDDFGDLVFNLNEKYIELSTN